MKDPILQKSGAGLPFFERFFGRYVYVPFHTKRTTWDESVARFEKEGQRILKLIAPLSNDFACVPNL